MRFITEFELIPSVSNENILLSLKDNEELKIGRQIAEAFNWKEKGFVEPSQLAGIRYSLEIEAFPMDKWVEFRVELIKHLSYCISVNEPPKALIVLELIKELESFDKPVGEAKEQQP